MAPARPTLRRRFGTGAEPASIWPHSGGVSSYYTIPSWQTNVSTGAESGSTIWRNIPDVALNADNVYVISGGSGANDEFGGTSCAAPLWAGFMALVNQQAAANGESSARLHQSGHLRHSQGVKLCRLFPRCHHRQQHVVEQPEFVLCHNRLRSLHRPGHTDGTNLINALTTRNSPYFITQPSSQTVTNGASVTFSATAAGQSPLSYRWLFNGTNLPAGGNISGTTSNVLSITAATTNNSGNYSLVVTNSYGSATSSVATLTVVLPPTISVLAHKPTIQCGSNAAFSVTASGTPPLSHQWSLDGSPVTGATNTSFSLTNLHLPNHTVTVIVTNLYGSATSNVTLTVQDTLAPVITLNSTNPFYIELGGAYAEPGATANDLCAGVVSVATNGVVNTNAVGTNTVTYTASDGNGNTNSATRTVIVRDTTPPTISWSFTNLVLAAETNCNTTMPDVTGTNFIIATDLSGALTFSQSPTNNAVLPLGTNVVVITVADASGNKSYSTNRIVVRDQTPPSITCRGQPGGQRRGRALRQQRCIQRERR